MSNRIDTSAATAPANDDRKSAIVTIRRKGRAVVPDMTPEEHQRRGNAADAMFQDMKRRIAAKDRTWRLSAATVHAMREKRAK